MAVTFGVMVEFVTKEEADAFLAEVEARGEIVRAIHVEDFFVRKAWPLGHLAASSAGIVIDNKERPHP